MPVSRYPRVGQRIAPKILALLLDTPAPGVGRHSRARLKDFDDSVWERFTNQRCLQFADDVIAHVRPWFHSLPIHLRDKHLPCPPEWVRSDDIQVDQRTHNRLDAFGFLKMPQELGRRTLGDIVKIPAFGVRSLVDLLCAIESFVAWVPSSDRHPAITRQAKKLRHTRNVERIRSDDPRFGTMIRSIGIPAPNALALADALIDRTVDPTEPDIVVRRLRRLRHHIAAAERMTLTAELYNFTASAKTERNREITMKYFGWSSNAPRTLESVGDEYGMTRERVRQVCETVVAVIHRPRPFAPTLDRTLRWIMRRLPAGGVDLEAKLAALEFIRGSFDLRSVITAAHELDRTSPLQLTYIANVKVVVAPGTDIDVERLLYLARRSVSHWGVASVEDIAEQLKEESYQLRDRELVGKLLSFLPDFVWLDRTSGWFWLSGAPRNSLLTQIKKIFAVTKHVTLRDLRAGVSRHHRRKGFAPPRRVLAELLRQLPYCQVLDERVIVDQQSKLEDALSPTEQKMVAVLAANEGMMGREAFGAACRARGIKDDTFSLYLTYSPIIEKYARGVYGLRGRDVMPGEVEALIPKPTRQGRVLVDYGWTKTQEVLLIYKLSEGLISSGVASVPSSLQSVLAGKHSMRASDGAAVGTLVVQRNSAWGLLPFFRRRGGDVGDYLSIAVNPKNHSALLSLGDESLLDDLGGVGIADL